MGKIRYNRTGRTLVCPFGHECQFFDPRNNLLHNSRSNSLSRNNHWDSTPLLPVGIAAGITHRMLPDSLRMHLNSTGFQFEIAEIAHGKGGSCCEENISAEEAAPEEGTRFQKENGNFQRKKGFSS